MKKSDKAMLKEVEGVEVLSLMDNYVDLLLESNRLVTRPARSRGQTLPTDTLVAEHGFSLLVTVLDGKEKRRVLLDTGYTATGVLHNADYLEVDLEQVETLIMSHRHMDHTGSLWPILVRFGKPLSLAIHPLAFLSPRFLQLPDGKMLRFPETLVRAELEEAGVAILETQEPLLIAGGRILVTGEIERTTGFEKGLPNAYMEQGGKLVKDPIRDDQSLVIHVKGKGLVVISGCAHAGIINTLWYAEKITGVDRIYAVMGGFHLSGPTFEPAIDETVNSLKRMNPRMVAPMHCTGWKALRRFEAAFPDAFVLNSVGSKYTLPFQ